MIANRPTPSDNVKDEWRYAEIAVKFAAKMFEEGWKMQFIYEPDNPEDQAQLNQLLQDRGLIPAQEELPL